MTIHDIINPKNFTLTLIPGKLYGNNDRDPHMPFKNWDIYDWRRKIQKNNPLGDMPCLNPQHYINPLTGHYSSGPLDFSCAIK